MMVALFDTIDWFYVLTVYSGHLIASIDLVGWCYDFNISLKGYYVSSVSRPVGIIAPTDRVGRCYDFVVLSSRGIIAPTYLVGWCYDFNIMLFLQYTSSYFVASVDYIYWCYEWVT